MCRRVRNNDNKRDVAYGYQSTARVPGYPGQRPSFCALMNDSSVHHDSMWKLQERNVSLFNSILISDFFIVLVDVPIKVHLSLAARNPLVCCM